MKRVLFLSIGAVLMVSWIAATALPKTADHLDNLTVHEWGTFTSVAGVDGQAVRWRTYSKPGDLPCFVERFAGVFKDGLFGTVRMETPVLYFYGPSDVRANVKVQFPKGMLTEWYPKAVVKDNAYNTIEWRDIRVSSQVANTFPSGGSSHYYAARETDAVPVQVGDQTEKFLFYRGVGNFAVPLAAKLEGDGRIQLQNLGKDAIHGVILFENHNGHVRYRLSDTLAGGTTVESESPSQQVETLFADLENVLVGHGLYPKEAKAMIATWRDSWFEEGTRVFYIVPETVIDSVLPLQVQPAPAQIARVFVGRMEIITPAIEQDVRRAAEANDRETLKKYGRFLGPIAERIGLKSAVLDAVYSEVLSQSAACAR
jgi:hypothetical protein